MAEYPGESCPRGLAPHRLDAEAPDRLPSHALPPHPAPGIFLLEAIEIAVAQGLEFVLLEPDHREPVIGMLRGLNTRSPENRRQIRGLQGLAMAPTGYVLPLCVVGR